MRSNQAPLWTSVVIFYQLVIFQSFARWWLNQLLFLCWWLGMLSVSQDSTCLSHIWLLIYVSCWSHNFKNRFWPRRIVGCLVANVKLIFNGLILRLLFWRSFAKWRVCFCWFVKGELFERRRYVFRLLEIALNRWKLFNDHRIIFLVKISISVKLIVKYSTMMDSNCMSDRVLDVIVVWVLWLLLLMVKWLRKYVSWYTLGLTRLLLRNLLRLDWKYFCLCKVEVAEALILEELRFLLNLKNPSFNRRIFQYWRL